MTNMRKTEFVFHREIDKLHEIEAGKYEDYELPEFSKEVPVASRMTFDGNTAVLEHDWKEAPLTQSIRVKRAEFRKSEHGLYDLHRIAARDGTDSITFRYNGSTYILRRTAGEIAKAIYKAYDKIRCGIENIVGCLKTMLGNDYVIAKVDEDSWAFDKRISKANVHYVDVDSLDSRSKSKLCEMAIERITELHRLNLVIGGFSLSNILLGRRNAKLTDLRKLRVSRKRSVLVEEFKSMVQYLLAIGVANKADAYYSVAYYTTHNEGACDEWYSNTVGRKAKDSFEIASRMEQEIY